MQLRLNLLLIMHCKLPSSVYNATNFQSKSIWTWKRYICPHPKYEVLCSVRFFFVFECMRNDFLKFNKGKGGIKTWAMSLKKEDIDALAIFIFLFKKIIYTFCISIFKPHKNNLDIPQQCTMYIQKRKGYLYLPLYKICTSHHFCNWMLYL